MKTPLKIVYYLFVGIISTHSQTNSISGKITSKGEALPFANVYLANTKLGTASNEEGFFELKNIDLIDSGHEMINDSHHISFAIIKKEDVNFRHTNGHE